MTRSISTEPVRADSLRSTPAGSKSGSTGSGDRAVVIGAGHNGLTAANYLVTAGYDVTVLEASARIGGMTATVPLVGAAPDHLLSPCAIDAVYWAASTVSDDLSLARYGLRTIEHDPAWCWLDGDGDSLVLRRDVQATVDEIRRFSPGDARRYETLLEGALELLAVQDVYGAGDPLRPGRRALLRMAGRFRSRALRRAAAPLLAGSAAEMIDDLFESDAVRGVFACMASILGSITQDSSAFGLLATAPLHRYGVLRPVGGMQAIPDALTARLREHGGSVLTDSEVVGIVTESGRCTGVELAGGLRLPADVVVSAVPPQVTARLLDEHQVTGLGALGRAPANASGIGAFTINLALRGRLQVAAKPRHDGVDLRRPTLFFGTLEQVLAAEAECRRGLVPTDPPWTGTILSATDPTQAPDGQDGFYLYGPAPIDPHGGWAVNAPVLSDRLIGAAGAMIGGIEAMEIGRFTESPRDLEARLAAPNGSIYHVDQVISRIGPARPAVGWGGHRSRVPGLYLSGAGTHPGGGVSGIPGQLAARAVLTDRRSTARRPT